MISSRVTHCQQPGSSIGTQLRAKLFREEPEAGNLHIRVGPLGQEPRLGLQPFADDAGTLLTIDRPRLWKDVVGHVITLARVG